MKTVILCLVLFVHMHVFAQVDSLPAQDSRPFTTKQKIVVGALVVQQAASFYVQYNWWWKDDYHSFNVEPDGYFNNYSLGIDKIGHFYTSYVYFHLLNETMRWADFSPKARRITSTVLPLAWAVSIEIGDGFSGYGYSWEDLTANTLGIAYGLLQEKVPYMRNFKFKFSYYPSNYYVVNRFKGWVLTDDYRSQFYWLSFDIHNLLPKGAQRFWPPFLNMAVGYGIDKNTERFATPTVREFGLSFDWNFSSIKTKSKSVYWLKEMVDYIHFPAPGVTKKQGESAVFKPILVR